VHKYILVHVVLRVTVTLLAEERTANGGTFAGLLLMYVSYVEYMIDRLAER